MKKQEIIECFIPAQALEHPANGEYYTLTQKLRMALFRLHHTGNFNDSITVQDPIPHIFIKDTVFNPVDLGYHVRARVC